MLLNILLFINWKYIYYSYFLSFILFCSYLFYLLGYAERSHIREKGRIIGMKIQKYLSSKKIKNMFKQILCIFEFVSGFSEGMLHLLPLNKIIKKNNIEINTDNKQEIINNNEEFISESSEEESNVREFSWSHQDLDQGLSVQEFNGINENLSSINSEEENNNESEEENNSLCETEEEEDEIKKTEESERIKNIFIKTSEQKNNINTSELNRMVKKVQLKLTKKQLNNSENKNPEVNKTKIVIKRGTNGKLLREKLIN